MDSSTTSLTLLGALRDPNDQEAWQRFDEQYRPVVLSLGRGLGLDVHDAEDAAQKTVLGFRKSYAEGKYQPEKGRFKNWLLGIARHQIADILEQRARQPVSADQGSTIAGVIASLQDTNAVTTLWDKEWRAHVLRLCFAQAEQRFSPRDIRIFRMLTSEGHKIDDVAAEMNITYTAVRQVKHRILMFMRRIRPVLEQEF